MASLGQQVEVKRFYTLSVLWTQLTRTIVVTRRIIWVYKWCCGSEFSHRTAALGVERGRVATAGRGGEAGSWSLDVRIIVKCRADLDGKCSVVSGI
jgi:hypothetical protein